MQREFAAHLAIKNIDKRKEKFKGEIEESVRGTKRYTLTETNALDAESVNVFEHNNCTTVSISDKSIIYYLRVMLMNIDGKTAVLNPGSYFTPGGGYSIGAPGYESELCSVTTLYEVLSGCNDYYDWNRRHTNNGLYTNVCLYTPGIIVCDNRNYHVGSVDVITCSAPDFSKAPIGKCESAIHSRIELIFKIAACNNVRNLILCGFGCEQSGASIEFIAKTFSDICAKNMLRFDSIVFVMGDDKYINEFSDAFGTDNRIKMEVYQ